MIIWDSEKGRAHWKTRMLYELLPGHNNITRAVKLQAVKLYLERVVQQFHPFKLRCDQKQTKEANKIELSVNDKELCPQWNAAAIAAVNMKEQMEN